ncbi:intermembrane phospholipid transport protein YdbH family protein [Sphingomonas suaedae]|uniref:intermembrane phospholipid transport protein YdbH family protein n=1 Tax=Sphingomonas suaedae TaxID=2599297 RepID=UPI001644C959|nr:YdbH domain-containing protein [Sphingomonas suaedae]
MLALFLLLLAVLSASWVQRRTIARDFIDAELTRLGVPARYEISQLSPWRQRLRNVVIGDARRPDLVADWVEIQTALAPWRADVLAVRAGRVRLRGRLVNGTLSLGTIDRLLPPPSGKPFALPALIVDVADAQIALDTPAGAVQLAIAGEGMLNDGFRGSLGLASRRVALAGCTIEEPRAQLVLRIRKGQPDIDGPASANSASCAQGRVLSPRLIAQARLNASLDQWKGKARFQGERFDQPGLRFSALRGNVSFHGGGAGTSGTLALESGAFDVHGNSGKSAALDGRYVQGSSGLEFRGQVATRSVALAPATLARFRQASNDLQSGPLQPIVNAVAQAATGAARSFDAQGGLHLTYSDGRGALKLSRVVLSAASGARLTFDGDARAAFGKRASPLQAEGTLALRGGGLPEAVMRVSQGQGEIRGSAFVKPYAVGGSQISLADIAFRLRGEDGEASTLAIFTGTLPQGRVEQLILPLSARWRAGSLLVNPSCTRASFRRLAIGSVILAPNSLSLCPIGSAMVQVDRNGLGGGIQIRQPRFTGALGESALSVAADHARFDIGQQRFSLAGAALRLVGTSETRLDVAQLSGTLANSRAGRFSGLSAQMSGVPLLLSGGEGDWALDRDTLKLTGALQVRDANEPVRFHPLATPDAEVRVVSDTVTATATLNMLEGGARIADVRIDHDLNEGRGSAVIGVRDLRFAQAGLQPHNITPLTFGLIADVDGTVSGEGKIAWSDADVTSSGTFTTRDMDLAAAFGPVRGLTTELQFADLLGMRTAPGQTGTVAEINPGVPVVDGKFRFQILDSQRVQIESARWPFAGGELVLEPTLLDFSESRERRMTFRVVGADAALFLKEMEFGNISATGTFDGTLPIIFDAQGGRIEGGILTARGGGSLAYIGEVTRHDLGFWGNMAFQALRSLDYRSLSIDMNGSLAGNMVTEIRFAGVSQGEGAKSNFLVRRLARLPFIFDIRISAPFQQLLDSVQSWYEPSRLIERNLPALLEAEGGAEGLQPQEKPVQQSESGDVRREEQK